MTTHYPADLKQLALEILRDTGGDINQAHIKTGVPERTLYNWRREIWQNWRRNSALSVLPNPPKPLPQFENDLEAMNYIRQKIMAELLNLANNFQTDANFMTPAQRITLLTQLTDRFIKLDEHVRARIEEQEDEEDEDDRPFEIDYDIEPKDNPDYPNVDDDELQPIYEH